MLGVSALAHLSTGEGGLLSGGLGALIVGPDTLSELKLWVLVTSTLVATPSSFLGFAIFLVIAGLLFQDRLRVRWREDPVRLALTLGIPVAVLVALSRWAPQGVVWGMAAAAVMLLWFGTSVERRWGPQRLLLFCLLIAVATNLFAAAMFIVWPTSISPAFGVGGRLPFGVGPLADALITVWCLMNGHHYFPLLRVQVKKLVWVLVAICVLDFLLEGRLSGMMGLIAIGVTCLLVRGLWRPRYLLDRARLWWIDRRVAKRRRRMRSIKGGRAHRAQRSGTVGVRGGAAPRTTPTLLR